MIKSFLNRVCVIAAFFAFAKAYSQESLPSFLGKEAAVTQMLENNFGILLANKELEIAENNTSILNGGYLPTLTANGGGSFDRSNSTTDFNGATDAQGNERPDIVIEDAETTQYNASLDLAYTLFDGLGRKYNFKQLEEQYNLTRLQVRETIENTMVQLFSVYYEVARLEENALVLEEALKISNDRAIRAAYQYEYGQVNKLDVLNAEVDITTDSINMLTARQDLRNAQRDLNVVLGRDMEALAMVDTTVTFVSPLVIDSFVEKARENNVLLLQNNSDIEITELQIKAAKSLFLPTIGLTGTYGWNLVNSPESAFFPGTTRNANSLTVGANLRWNLFDGGSAIIGLKNAKLVKESQEILKKQLEQQVYRDIENARGSYKNALTVYALQEGNLITTQNNFNRSQERLKLGQISSIEFRQAQLNLLNAQVGKNTAKYQAKIAELQVLQLAGQLLNIDF